jgi:GNAT superfamily N-acetyltransferase
VDVEIKNLKPTPEEFAELRAQVGWGNTDLKMAAVGLEQSLFHVTARMGSKLVGMGRVVGDGAMFFYVQDVVVVPKYQGKGIGNLLMEQIENYLSKSASEGSTIGLLSAQGKEPFYSRYGYSQRTGAPLGYGMCKFL